jgi:uncharacterized protein DUF4397
MNASRRLAFLAAAAIVATACGTKDAADPLSPNGQQGRIRFVNLITDPARNPVNVILENVPFGVNLGYATSTPATLPAPATANFSPVLAGSRALVVQRTANTSVTVANASVTITAGQDHTVIATGGSAGGAVSITTFGTGDGPTAGQVRIRFINVSPGAVDVFVTAANADLAAATPSAANLPTGGFSVGITVAPGTYQVRTVPAGTAAAARAGAVNTSLTGLAVAAGGVRTIFFASSASGGTPLQSFALTDY